MNTRKRMHRTVLSATASALLLAGGTAPAAFAASASEQSVVPAIIEKTTPSVVAIIGKPASHQKTSSETGRYSLAHGTGVIVRSEGYILTNAHVVKDMQNITVVTSDGKSYAGKTTHFDEESDLALVKIEAAGLKPAVFAKASDIKVGESVMAIGTPLSFALRNSVSSGIVSGMERAVQSKYRLLQTDAAINPGNSGGALVNMNGEVIGINTMKFVEYGVDSLGFAIPVDTVQHVMDQFFKYGKVKRPYLGLELSESWEAVVGLPSSKGLDVSYVDAESPASKAGVKQGDVLTAIDSVPTRNLVEYNEALKNALPDQRVKLSLISDGKEKTTELTLGEDQSAAAANAKNEGGAAVDSDQGKTWIGDSYYGWSMKYPVGLVQQDQEDDGNTVEFSDAKGEFSIDIHVEDKQSPDLSPLGLLRKLDGQHYSETILEKRYVDAKPQPYAKLVGKRASGKYTQVRAYLKGDKVFYVALSVGSEELYKNGVKRNSYEDLLDSFTLSFDTKNKGLKDISVYQNNDTVHTDYGLSFEVPKEWSKGSYERGFIYKSKDKDKQLSVDVSSAASGETLEAWAKRDADKYSSTYAENYRKAEQPKANKAGGANALESRYSYTMGDKWKEYHVLYVLKDKYKYRVALEYPQSDAAAMDKTFAEVVNSISFPKTTANRSLGYIQDESELYDADRTVTYKNKKYGYGVSVPEAWTAGYSYGDATDAAMKSFKFEGGSFSIIADDSSQNLKDTLGRMEKEFKKNADTDTAYKYTVSDETLFDTPVKLFTTQYKVKNVPYNERDYIFEKNGKVYVISARINDAVKTDASWERLNKAIRSLTFEKSE